VKQRQVNADVLLDALRPQPAIRVPNPPADVEHAYYKFSAHLRPERLAAGWDRDRVIAAIKAEGVPCTHGGCAEIYRERAFRGIAGTPAKLAAAAELGRTSLMLLVHPNLSVTDMSDTAEAVTRVLGVATA
jgi:dTDP-4-amino-4,6-dideoxygalactose transaminase